MTFKKLPALSEIQTAETIKVDQFAKALEEGVLGKILDLVTPEAPEEHTISSDSGSSDQKPCQRQAAGQRRT